MTKKKIIPMKQGMNPMLAITLIIILLIGLLSFNPQNVWNEVSNGVEKYFQSESSKWEQTFKENRPSTPTTVATPKKGK